MVDQEVFDDEGDDNLELALAKLVDAIEPYIGNTDLIDFVQYLYMIWADFTVYQLEPFLAKDAEEGGGSDRTSEVKKVFTLANGRKIFDYGYCLKTSPGDDYGSYCTGKLIESAQEMIKILAKRGVTRVGFTGHKIAQRAAWLICEERNIEIVNFSPSSNDMMLQERLQAAKSKQARRLKGPATDPKAS